jgi:hypothetical protein
MNTSKRLRSANGQGVTEGVCSSLFIVFIFTLLVVFAVDAYIYAVGSAKMQLVANEAARVFRDNDRWNGALRPVFQRFDTEQIAHHEETANACANAVAKELGLTNLPGLSGSLYLSRFEHHYVTHSDGRFSEFIKVTFTMPYFNLPYKIAGLFPGVLSLNASAVTAQTTEPPPAFIRLGYKLISADPSNPANNTTVTQVCILPSYGFQTDPASDSIAPKNLGLNGANNDVVGNAPDDRYCGWNGLNVAMKQTPSNGMRPRLLGNAPRQKNSSGGYTAYFGGPLPPE